MQKLAQSDIRIQADTKKVLAALEKNLRIHVKEFKEAEAGYLIEAKALLMKELKRVKKLKGKNGLRSLSIHLSAPYCYDAEYATAITMMKYHTGETITLDPTQVRQFLMDEWDWSSGFKEAHVNYSNASNALR